MGMGGASASVGASLLGDREEPGQVCGCVWTCVRGLGTPAKPVAGGAACKPARPQPCRIHLTLTRDSAGGPPFIACTAWPLHRFRVDLPRITTSVTVADSACPACGAKELELGFTRALLPPGFEPRMTACAACDPQLKRLLALLGTVPRRGG